MTTRLQPLLVVLLVGCGGATNAPPPQGAAAAGRRDPGLVRVRSEAGFEDTVTQLEEAVTSRGLNVIARVPHSRAAEGAGLELRPTMLLLFGRPQVGTPLMKDAPTLALDLPQRTLVYEEGGTVWVVYNDPRHLAERHGLPDDDPRLGRVAETLAAIAADAARGPRATARAAP
jgi:uncharacterized protein (DUF302 family)